MIDKLLRIKTSTRAEEFFLQSLPVVLFSLICLMLYEQGNKQRTLFFEDLNIKFQALDREMKEAENQNQTLLLQINSQSDPAFVELTLKKVLGVVPEGEIKVYFSEKAHSLKNLQERKSKTTASLDAKSY